MRHVIFHLGLSGQAVGGCLVVDSSARLVVVTMTGLMIDLIANLMADLIIDLMG